MQSINYGTNQEREDITLDIVPPDDFLITEGAKELNKDKLKTSLKRLVKNFNELQKKLNNERIYGKSEFDEPILPSFERIARSIAIIEGVLGSTTFAIGTVDFFEKYLQILHTDLLTLAGPFLATPNSVLLARGTQEILADILKRPIFRPQDVAFGITHRWSLGKDAHEQAYNHDNKKMYLIELMSLLIIHAAVFLSAASALSIAYMEGNHENYLPAIFLNDDFSRILFASITTYIPIFLVNAKYFTQFTNNLLNRLAAKLGDTKEIAELRSTLNNYLLRIEKANYGDVDVQEFLKLLQEYSDLRFENNGYALLKKQLAKIVEIGRKLDILDSKQIEFYTLKTIGTTFRGLMRLFGKKLDNPFTVKDKNYLKKAIPKLTLDAIIGVTSFAISSLSTIPTLNLSYAITRAPWLEPWPYLATAPGKCVVGYTIGEIAALVSLPLNYLAMFEVLSLLRDVKYFIPYLKSSDYFVRRNLGLTLIFALLSATISFFVAYNSPMDFDKECLPNSEAFMGWFLEEVFKTLNAVLPYINAAQTFSLVIFSILKFLNSQLLKVHY